MYTLYGAQASPYSVKMRAVLRYKRLAHTWAHPRTAGENVFAHVKVPVIPVLRFPDGSWRNDSTPMIRAIEAAHPARAVTPPEEAEAFLGWLLEDFADEWGTKIMFQERWAHEGDRDVNARSIVGDGAFGASEGDLRRAAYAFRDRQVGRMALVGCTPANAEMIEHSERVALEALDWCAMDGPWLFGSRPSAADFAWYGQFWQLLRDPTPRNRMRAEFPNVFAWLEATDDAGAVEGAWRGPADGARRLIRLAAELYLPFLRANAEAIEQGKDRVEITWHGCDYVQAPFKYQQRCLNDLCALYAALSVDGKARVDAALGAEAAIFTLCG